MKKILFVCMGNICRSPLAEGIARVAATRAGLSLEFDSAGTTGYHAGEGPDPRARAVARQRGTPIDDLRARQVVEEDFLRFDLLLAADRDNLRYLQRLRPQAEGRIGQAALLLGWVDLGEHSEVPDPYYGDTADFERVHLLLTQAIDAMIAKLGAEKNGH